MSYILVVDDEEIIRGLLQICLANQAYGGHNVSVAENGCEAEQMIISAATNGRSFDLVISDIDMPGMNGYALACRIFQIFPSLPFILMSGRKQPPQWSGFFIAKPFNLNELAILVKLALNRSYTPPRVNTPPPSAPPPA